MIGKMMRNKRNTGIPRPCQGKKTSGIPNSSIRKSWNSTLPGPARFNVTVQVSRAYCHLLRN